MAYTFEYVIDISGSFPENTYFGMCSYIVDQKNNIWNDFVNEFPDLKSDRYKSTKLSERELYEVAKFLDE